MIVCLIRSMILYLLLVLAIRLMGKRQIGEMGPSEFVVTLVISDLASVPMQDLGIPLFSGIVPILTVLAAELLFSSLSFSCIPLRKLFNGKPVILIEQGKIIPESLKKTRLTPDELSERLREKGITDLTTVSYAILETGGQISVLVHPRYQPPTAQDLGISVSDVDLPWTIISNGRVLEQNLNQSGKNEAWLDHLLRTHGCQRSDVMLLTVTSSGTIYLTLEGQP